MIMGASAPFFLRGLNSLTSLSFNELIEAAQDHRNSGQLSSAIDVLHKARLLPPKSFRDWTTLSRSYFECEIYPLARMCAQAAESADALQADFGRIQQAMARPDINTAKSIAQEMLSKEPGHPRAVFTLVHIARSKGRHEASVEHLKAALELSPANLFLRQLLVQSLEDLGETATAAEQIQKLVILKDDVETRVLQAQFLFRHGRNAEALNTLTDLDMSGLNSKLHSEIDLLKGQIFKVLGRRSESEGAFRTSLEHNPYSGSAWAALADMKNYIFSKDDKATLDRIWAARDLLPDQKSQAGFALAKAAEQDAGPKAAMAIYHRANAAFSAASFSGKQFGQAIERIKQGFDVVALSQQAGPSKPVPIFILGMPRSGSTLVEQILASHSVVTGTQELLCLPSVKRSAHLLATQKYGGGYLDKIGAIETADLEKLGQDYLRLSAFYHQNETPYFIDKLPYNFEHIGLIHKILPQAIIIDTRRNPMDCGLSIYKQFFARGSEYSYNLAHIGAYYNGYLKLMDHWDSVLPGRVFRIQYETLIEDTEAVVRQLLDHTGLEFESDCLKFYENKRAVRTASSEQVRQPINRKGIGAWRQVELELQPLKDALGPETLARFERELSL